MFTVFIAALVPDLAPFISLIGAVFFSILGLMCPAIIHLVVFWEHSEEECNDSEDSDSEDDLDYEGDYYGVDDDTDLQDSGANGQPQGPRNAGRSAGRKKGMTRWAAVKDVAIIAIALIALVSGTYASLVDIVAFYGAASSNDGGAHTANTTTSTTIGPGPESAFLMASASN